MEEHRGGQKENPPEDSGSSDDNSRFTIPPQGTTSDGRLSRPPLPSRDADESTWNQIFERYGDRIEAEEADRKTEMAQLRKRSAVVFYLYAAMAILTIISAALTSVLAVLYAMKHGFGLPPVASGGVFFVTGGVSVVLLSMRRQIRNEERGLSERLDKLEAIEASMYAARVATNSKVRCEMLAEMTRVWNTLETKHSRVRPSALRRKSAEQVPQPRSNTN